MSISTVGSSIVDMGSKLIDRLTQRAAEGCRTYGILSPEADETHIDFVRLSLKNSIRLPLALALIGKVFALYTNPLGIAVELAIYAAILKSTNRSLALDSTYPRLAKQKID